MREDMTVSIVKQGGIKVMIVSRVGVTWDEILLVVYQAIKGAGFIPMGELGYSGEDDHE